MKCFNFRIVSIQVTSTNLLPLKNFDVAFMILSQEMLAYKLYFNIMIPI